MLLWRDPNRNTQDKLQEGNSVFNIVSETEMFIFQNVVIASWNYEKIMTRTSAKTDSSWKYNSRVLVTLWMRGLIMLEHFEKSYTVAAKIFTFSLWSQLSCVTQGYIQLLEALCFLTTVKLNTSLFKIPSTLSPSFKSITSCMGSIDAHLCGETSDRDM